MTREILIPKETWTLITISNCSFQSTVNMQVAESATIPTDWSDPKKVILKSKIYEYYSATDSGLWGICADNAIVTIDDTGAISEEYKSPEIRKAYNDTYEGFDVVIQDQVTPPVIAKFNNVQAGTTLAIATSIDDKSITVADSTGFIIGSYVVMYSTDIDRYYVGYVLGVSGNVLSLDTPFDAVYPAGSIVASSITNMAIDGSVTPQVFGLRGTPVENPLNLVFDITRIIFHCITDGLVDLSKFADIAGGITNGLVLRRRNGEYGNIFNVKTNSDLAGIMYDFAVEQADNPAQGQNGFYCRLTFAGQSKLGVSVRLAEGEDLEFIVQDDLSSITLLEVVAEGHIVDV
jgi:hypothetical protein